jgi:hypothetical protein
LRINVPGSANIDERAAPILCKKAGPFQAEPFVVATCHYKGSSSQKYPAEAILAILKTKF